MMTMTKLLMWLQIGTGFMGAVTLMFLLRSAARRFGRVPSTAAFFSPKGGCMEALVRELKAARKEILVQAYSFTSEPITMALVDAKKRGLHVEVLLDHSNEKEQYSDLHIFLEHGLPPLIDSNHPIAHNKVMIIDQKTIVTGSYNFTNQAEHENAENMLIIKGNPELVRAYRQSFLAHKAHCKPPQAKAPGAPQAKTPADNAAHHQRRAA
jgi:phosphatidylserine/phosphatidylglycerophosphate/cardiolipin synthase-like enzyme